MKHLSIIFSVIAGLLASAVAQVPKSTIASDIGTAFPDNTLGLITPATTRNFLNTLYPSYQQYAGVRAVVATTDTIGTGDYGQLVTYNNASPVAVTLPPATGSFATFSVYVKNLGVGAVTITPTASTINGAASISLSQNGGQFIISDGTNWQVWGGLGGSAVTSVALAMPGIFTISGSPVTSTGTLTATPSGTSGGVPYFSTSSALSSSAALTANLPVIGGGAGSAPSVGTRSGNTTQFATVTGSLASTQCVGTDASGNIQTTGSPCASSTGAGPSLAGDTRNLKITQGSTTTLTVTADQIVTATSLSGTPFLEASASHTLTITSTGANGMDTGTAPTSGYICVYSITKGDGSTFAVLGSNAATNACSTIYPGANIPSGYTASGLIAIWGTDGAAHVASGTSLGRKFTYASPCNVTSSLTGPTSLTLESIANCVPVRAITASGLWGSALTHGQSNLAVASSTAGAGLQPGAQAAGAATTIGGVVSSGAYMFFKDVPILTSQQIAFYELSNSANDLIYITDYSW